MGDINISGAISRAPPRACCCSHPRSHAGCQPPRSLQRHILDAENPSVLKLIRCGNFQVFLPSGKSSMLRKDLCILEKRRQCYRATGIHAAPPVPLSNKQFFFFFQILKRQRQEIKVVFFYMVMYHMYSSSTEHVVVALISLGSVPAAHISSSPQGDQGSQETTPHIAAGLLNEAHP